MLAKESALLQHKYSTNFTEIKKKSFNLKLKIFISPPTIRIPVQDGDDIIFATDHVEIQNQNIESTIAENLIESFEVNITKFSISKHGN